MKAETKSRHSHCGVGLWWIWWWLLLSLCSCHAAAKAATNGKATGFPLEGILPDPLVQVSPLVVGIQCRDGVLLVAVHSVFQESNEALLLAQQQPQDDEMDTDQSNESNGLQDRNLPKSYKGPVRIHSVSPTAAMVCAGWRTDGGLLARALRNFDTHERWVFGGETTGSEAMADRAATVLAQSHSSSSRRSLSCVGLLATSGSKLWVVDATGAYAVKAHALGTNAQVLHQRVLRQTDWRTLDHETVLDELMKGWFSENNDNDEDEALKLPKGSRVEMALIESTPSSTQSSVRRLFFPIHKQT